MIMRYDTFPPNLVKYVSSLAGLLRRALTCLPHALLHKTTLGVNRVEAPEEQGQGTKQKQGREQKQGGEEVESRENKESREQDMWRERVQSYQRTPERPPKPHPGLKVNRKRTRRMRNLMHN